MVCIGHNEVNWIDGVYVFKIGLKMSSRSVIVDERFCFEEESHLTVHKTSVFVPGGDGFIVYYSVGEIIFRVDSYGLQDELVLMDSAGKSLVTLHCKKPSRHQRWEAFLGEKKEEQQEPIFRIFKSSIIGPFDVVAMIYGDPSEYHTAGSFSNGSHAIPIYNTKSNSESKELVAEIKRKVDPDTNVVLGKDVFSLCIKPRIDGAVVMALVIVLEQLGGFEIDDSIANQLPAVLEGVSS